MENPTYGPNSVSNILSCSTLSDFLTEMTLIILTLYMLEVVDSSRIFFENMVRYFQKCFRIWKGARVLKKIFHNRAKNSSP